MSGFNITTKTPTFSSSLSPGSQGPTAGVNNNNSSKERALGSDVFSCCHEMSFVDDSMRAGMSAVQPGLDGHLPLLHTQDDMLLDLNSSGAYLDSSSLGYSDGNSMGPLFERRKRSRSNSSRHRFNEVVTELVPEEVRWFYKEDKKTWKPFVGHDSLNIELMFRKYCELNPNAVFPKADGGDEESGGKGEESPGQNGAVPGETRTSSMHGGRGSVDTSTVSSDDRDPNSIEIYVEPVCVRGGLYEVDIKERECYPVYWKRKYNLTMKSK